MFSDNDCLFFVADTFGVVNSKSGGLFLILSTFIGGGALIAPPDLRQSFWKW